MTVRDRIAMLLIAALAACDQEPVAAVLADASDETMSQLRSALASALGRSSVTLGVGDVTAMPEVRVLPPAVTPLEGNSTAMPIVFDILLLNGDCYLRRRGSSDLVALFDVACIPAAD